MLTIGSLFSGIGGLELGLERAGLGPVLWQVEIDERCQDTLRRHWPDSEVWGDIRGVHGPTGCEGSEDRCACPVLWPVDLVCGGFPCQGIAAPGRRRGLADPRSGLWSEFVRVIGEIEPAYVVVENSPLLDRRGLDVVLFDLATLGYDAIWFPLSAADVGAPHGRERLFVVAYPDDERRDMLSPSRVHADRTRGNDAHRRHRFPPRRGDTEGWREVEKSMGPQPGLRRDADGFSVELDAPRVAALGNAVVPQVAEVVGWVVRGIQLVVEGNKS